MALSNYFESIRSVVYNISKSYTRESTTITDSPILFLGRYYDNESDKNWAIFQHDFSSQFWFSYRTHYQEPLPWSNFTSDTTWGCLLRTSQMMIAHALVRQILGRDWRWDLDHPSNLWHNTIVSWFADRPGSLSPYSIHNFYKLAASLNVKPGEWLTSDTVCNILKLLVRSHSPLNLTMTVAGEMGVVSRKSVELMARSQLMTIKSPRASDIDDLEEYMQREWRPTILMIPVRLGLHEVTETGFKQLRQLFQMEQCIGFIGGKPGLSTYLCGIQDESFLYYDPHYAQKSVVFPKDSKDLPLEDAKTFHVERIATLHYSLLDPCMTLGFLISDQDQFDLFCNLVSSLRETFFPEHILAITE